MQSQDGGQRRQWVRAVGGWRGRSRRGVNEVCEANRRMPMGRARASVPHRDRILRCGWPAHAYSTRTMWTDGEGGGRIGHATDQIPVSGNGDKASIQACH
eukprot:351851-Chlamydomonas_euryale.AAC.2